MAEATQGYSISEAATAIRDLINSQSHSPHQHEIEGIIAKVSRTGSITSTAQEINSLFDLESALEPGEYYQNKLPEREPDDTAPPPFDYKTLCDAIVERRDVLLRLALGLEAENIDDVLSLLLIVDDAFGTFSTNHSTRGANHRAEREAEAIERALGSAIRQLATRAGAKSPILRNFTAARALLPPDEHIAAALARARDLQAADTEGRTNV